MMIFVKNSLRENFEELERAEGFVGVGTEQGKKIKDISWSTLNSE